MRLVPAIFAIICAGLLYFFVVDRDRLRALVGPPEQVSEQQADEPEPSQEAQRGGPPRQPLEQDQKVNVVVRPVTAGEVELGISFAGTSTATRFVDVRAQASGLVVSNPMRKGSSVAKDDVLCQLDPGTKAIALEEALTRLRGAEDNEQTAAKLAADGFGTEASMTAAQIALQSAITAVETAEREIEQLTITAPFDGLMESDAAEYGSLLQPGSLCARIIQINPIKIVGYVSQIEVGKIDVADTAKVNFASGLSTSGDVTFISRQADPETKTFEVEITLNNDEYRIRDGFTAEVTVVAGTNRAHFIPQSSFTLNDAGVLGVRVVENETVKFYAVDLVLDTPEGAWVAGLPTNVDLIVVGQEFVVDGTVVQTTYQEGSS